MTPQEATQDTAGNVLRKTSSGWEILQKGVGWREFIGYTVLTDGRIVDTRPVQELPDTPQDMIDQSQHQKQLEDDLFRHYAGIILGLANVYEKNESVVNGVCNLAQAMIDELKKRGRL